jgi:uncharacterized membrane protein
METRQVIQLAVQGFEAAGIIVLVVGTVITLAGFVFTAFRAGYGARAYQAAREGIGKAILLGLELLVAADIIRTVAIDPTIMSVAVLGLIVLIRTFLSWALEVEITGRWPWQNPAPQPEGAADHVAVE